jgi:hypothetical protein
MVAYNNKKYYIDIVETKPSNAISIIETDCEVDFAPPLDYKEPERVKPAVPASAEPTTGNALASLDVVTLVDASYFVTIRQEALQFFCFFPFFQRLQKNQSSPPLPVREGVWTGSSLRIKMCWPLPLQSVKLMQPMACSPQHRPRHRVVHHVRPQESSSSVLVEIELIR